jgi:hypothetical protein
MAKHKIKLESFFEFDFPDDWSEEQINSWVEAYTFQCLIKSNKKLGQIIISKHGDNELVRKEINLINKITDEIDKSNSIKIERSE